MQPFDRDVKIGLKHASIGSPSRDLLIGNAVRTEFIRIFFRQAFRCRQKSIQY
jgi:hypothetical protein